LDAPRNLPRLSTYVGLLKFESLESDRGILPSLFNLHSEAKVTPHV
jgi:hypothetical protein